MGTEVLLLAFAGASSTFSVFVSASVWFIGQKILSVPSTQDLCDWWFNGPAKSWRLRARFMFTISMPTFLLSIAMQPEVWCRQMLLATTVMAVFAGLALVVMYLVCFGPLPVLTPIHTLHNRKQASEREMALLSTSDADRQR